MKLPKIRKEDKLKKKIDDFLDEEPPKIVMDKKRASEDIKYLRAVMEKHEADLKAYDSKAKALHEVAEAEKASKSCGLGKDTIFGGCVTLACVFGMLAYEQRDVIRSKALSFIPKMRL